MPAPKNPNTAAATAATLMRGDLTAASRLRRHGWVVTEPGDYGTDLDSATLARAHLGYGPGHDEATDNEFWRRFPHLHGWYLAMEWLGEQQNDRWYEDNGGFNPMGEFAPVSAEYTALLDKYRAMVLETAEASS